MEILSEDERTRFGQTYCGLCRTLGKHCGAASRLILNFDFTFLSILLSDGQDGNCICSHCIASPIKKRSVRKPDAAMLLAADESVILAWWQLKDSILDHGPLKGIKYRLFSLILHHSYRKAAKNQPEFDRITQKQLCKLAQLEKSRCSSMDLAADTFAELLANASDSLTDSAHRRILYEILYHLGRWIYLIDAADDLEKDTASGNYNPLIFRYHLKNGVLDSNSRREFETTLDHSIHRIASAYELWDFGCWSTILEKTIYTGLFQVGKAVLDGNFHPEHSSIRKIRLLRKRHEQSL
jgi:hypothetical protein